jgi:hypothetical protein
MIATSPLTGQFTPATPGAHKARKSSSSLANFGITLRNSPNRGEVAMPLVNRNAVMVKCGHWNCEPTLRCTFNAGSRRIPDCMP